MTDETVISITEIRGELKRLAEKIEEQGELSREILVTLKGGNNVTGLVTRMCLVKQSVKRAWWFLGVLSTAILGIAGWVIKRSLA